jgi:tetratricopeptide (TPR) repeat protein
MADHARMSESAPFPLAQAQQAYARGDHAHVLALLRPHADQAGAQALALLGNSALALGEHGLALQVLTRLHAKQPQLDTVARTLAGLHNRRGAALRRTRRDAQACADFERALRLQPAHREAGYNLALALDALGERAAALARLETHLEVHADDHEAWWLALEWLARAAPGRVASWLGWPPENAMPERGHAGAVTSFSQDSPPSETAAPVDALRHRPPPQDPARLAQTALALQQEGQMRTARLLGEYAYELGGRGQRSPSLRYALAARLALAPVMDSPQAIAHQRTRFGEEIARLEREWTPGHLARCEPALEQLAWSNFYLAYHGENDRELQAEYGRLIARAAASLAPAFATPPPRCGGRRIGLLSSSFRDCTAGAYFGGWIDWLREAGFETFVYQLGPQRDAATDEFQRRATHFHWHDGTLRELAERVRGDALDLLIYPELGMDARLLPLAALRLAPRQALGWGHPVTSGLASMDAFFTCAAMEPPDAATHYTETLLPLPGLGVDYARPPAPPPATRRELGLPENLPLVLFPQSLFKIHPDNDIVLAELRRQAPDARLVMFADAHPLRQQRFLARLPAGVAESIHWLPLVARPRYLQINRACDLMLDTLRWSGGNTSLDALSSGLPVLGCAGTTMRARQSAAMLAALGLERELLVAEPAALAPRAAALLADAAARQALAERIRAGLPALFATESARFAFLAAVRGLCPVS